ncbi:hypothetical protein ED312_21355 [Sinomicrobium pectinilyticum]|uniref:PEP-CTERM sorting domain-containing protein n=1 Tax=Sinomicrobium pectinilyticum TaxID=1084421 RepID=A0A3N0DIS4_SINP1|nr:hypothetical protein [Sinomicrobium pectinilyticum]RNL75565.1 hypothetical protein ED312_21355 [Sinomicrobium pectinilyticum]
MVSKFKCYAWLALGLLFFSGCSDDDNGNDRPEIIDFHFSNDAEAWSGDFADYPLGEEDFYELELGYAALPDPLDNSDGALRQTGNNHSDDLFMFIKRKITGLDPDREYRIYFDLRIASDAPEGSVGIGGSPAESVIIKAGAVKEEPKKKVNENDYYEMNIDKGNQSQPGEDMINLGNFSNETDADTYTIVQRSNTDPFTATSNADGELWLVIGTDSGFEGTTTIYYDSISVTFE